MNRYQIYLNPKSVSVLDNMAEMSSLTRSEIIRDVIDLMAYKYAQLLKAAQNTQVRNNPLLKMAGFAKGPSENISQKIKEIYLKD